MPRYIDFHAQMPKIPQDQLQQLKSAVGRPDNNGVKNIDAIFTKDGQGYCITDAPNADAVCRSHEAKGMRLGKGDVHEIASTLA